MYKAQIIAHSKAPTGEELITFIVTYPRIVHAEMLRHRNFSRNSASSRAIPFNKMVKMGDENPFIPLAWQRDHKGMQGNEYIIDNESIENCKAYWLECRDWAVNGAKGLNDENLAEGVTKQLCSRIIEPFGYVQILVTATEWENFFNLRCPRYEYKGETFKSKKDCINSYTHGLGKGFEEDRNHLNSLTDLGWLQINKSQAEIHIQAIAEMMYDDLNESTPKQLKAGEYHLPFIEIEED